MNRPEAWFLDVYFVIQCHKIILVNRELKKYCQHHAVPGATKSQTSSPRGSLHGCHHHGPFQQRKKPQSGNKKWIENTSFFIKNHTKTLHKNYTNTSWKSKHSSLLVMLSCLCFPVLLQVLSACCSANCAKCDVVPASVVKNNRM